MARVLLGRRDQLPAEELRLVAAPRSIRKVSRSLVASAIASSSALVGWKASETLLVAAELNELVSVVHENGIPHLKSCLKFITEPFLSFFSNVLDGERGRLALLEENGTVISAKYRFLSGSFGQSERASGFALLETSLEEPSEVLCTTVQDDQINLQVCVSGPIEEGVCHFLNLMKALTEGRPVRALIEKEVSGFDLLLTSAFYATVGVCSYWMIAYAHDLLQDWFRHRAPNASSASNLQDYSWRSETSRAPQARQKSKYTSNKKQKTPGATPKIQEKRGRNSAQLKFESANNSVANQLENKTGSVVDTEETLEKLGSKFLLDENMKQTLEENNSDVNNNTSQSLGGSKTNPDKDTLQTADSNRTNVNNEGNEVVHVIQEKRNHVDGQFKRRRRKKDKESKNGAEKEKQRRKGHK